MMSFICSWLTHRVDALQYFPNGCVKMKCNRCKGFYLMSQEYEVFTPWTPLLEKIYVEMTGARTWV